LRFLGFVLCGLIALAAPGIARAAHPPATAAAPPASAADAGSTYDKFVAAFTPERGLFTIWHASGQVALELRPDQFDKDYAELAVPVNGVGVGLFPGITDLAPVRIIRFVKQDDKVAILFPSTRFYAKPGSPESLAVLNATAPTVVGVAKVLAENKETGAVIIDASAFLDDITDVATVLSDLNGGSSNPYGSYRLDSQKSYFGESKAFPKNVILNAFQTFSANRGDGDALSATPDARNLQIRVQYNIAEIPKDDAYVPRIYDDRVGYFVNAHQDFTSDNTLSKDLNYIIRFNLEASDPSKAISPAKNPVVYYLSNTIPYKYRPAIRSALLEWNKAFERIGISNAVVVRDQPEDPNFDPDDIRYNVVRWLTEIQGGFAEAQLLYNPYTGEMIKSGVVIDSDLMRQGKFDYPVLVAPNKSRDGMLGAGEGGSDYLDNARLNFGYAQTALQLQGGSYYTPDAFANQFLKSIVLHESGHDFGLRHNFIGSEAYTAKNLQSKAFTAKYGTTSSVMEYAPTNLWPKGTPQGDYFQTVLGPYDYYAIKWGYARVPGAKKPQDELSTLRRWASAWSAPSLRFLSDEDVNWSTGEGVDPRNQQWDLTNDNIGWCETQMTMTHDLVRRVDSRFPHAGSSFDDLRSAFQYLVGETGRCGQIVARYIGGEYVSRSLRGDRGATMPLTAVPLATEKRAFDVLQRQVFSANAWNFSPALLRQLVTQYRDDDWLGNFPARHDIAIESIAAGYQIAILNRFFTPVTLQRLDDMDLKYQAGSTMDLGDLFAWMQGAVYGDIGSGRAIPLVRRNLQRNYAVLLSRMANSPRAGAPADAQALARHELGALHATIQAGVGRTSDLLTRAHLEALDTDVERALNANQVILTSGGLSIR
jgi:hypothetical protein